MLQQMTLRIYGHVQGVFFRDLVEKEANALGVVGFVRNMKDGSVEVVAQGSEEKLQQLYAVCEEGPKTAMVEDIDDKWVTIKKESFSDFKIQF